ncbi:MAG: 23S rRNA (pseudouridine(1915)-N(3))-methyltransferase RlmH, partial [Pseudomonadota bacterium]
MKLKIAAVGRLAPGPERALVEDYIARAGATGRSLALGPISLTEIDERKARTSAEQSAKLIDAAGSSHLIVLDERGKTLSSPDLAALLARLRDQGVAITAFAIGGADGHDAALRDRADRLL